MKVVTKQRDGYEPTISEVLEAVQTGFAKVDGRFEQVDGRFGELEYRMMAIEKRTGAVENTLEEVKETLNGIARAVDKDAIAILDHEHRISIVERTAPLAA